MNKQQFTQNQPSSADEKVIKFIADFRFSQTEKNHKCIESMFTKGYCYYFALILKNAFNDGSILFDTDKMHVVWEYKGLLYDINGVYRISGHLISLNDSKILKELKHID